jgi:hypothetical protein
MKISWTGHSGSNPAYEKKGTWVIDPDDPVGLVRQTDVCQGGASTGDANGQLKIEVTANSDLSVDVKLTGTVKNLTKVVPVLGVLPGAQVPVPEFDLDTGGPFNDRAYFRDQRCHGDLTQIHKQDRPSATQSGLVSFGGGYLFKP